VEKIEENGGYEILEYGVLPEEHNEYRLKGDL